MSSYYPSFNYMGINSLKDKNLIVVNFDGGDSGETDTFLSMEAVYTETVYGTRRIDYGAKYNSIAIPKISVMKSNKKDFTVEEVRDFLRWTTGVRQISYLDLLVEDEIVCSFLGRIINVLQHKMDSRTIGFTIEFESVSPYAYSPQQYISRDFNQSIDVEDGVLFSTGEPFGITSNGVLNNNASTFCMQSDGTLFIDISENIEINNKSDDLYSFVNMDVVFTNDASDYFYIENTTTGEKTMIENMQENEIIKLSQEQFITSNIRDKIFGNDFNFVWPRLAPGINNIIISCARNGRVEFMYRYPIKIGDIAIDLNETTPECINNL